MYRGFSVKAAEYLTKYYRVDDFNVLPWEIYTDKDFKCRLPNQINKKQQVKINSIAFTSL